VALRWHDPKMAKVLYRWHNFDKIVDKPYSTKSWTMNKICG
jgi:hypothetical protein